jgi:ABC-type dipeptide/oligopeptide/nickel transport system ATPase component
MDVLLDVKDLQTQFTTSGGVVRAVDGVSWDVKPSETVALVGESGCGKSVSALSVMRLVAAPAGRIVGGQICSRDATCSASRRGDAQDSRA